MAHLIIDICGAHLKPNEEKLLTNPVVAGVILFKRNYINPAQLISLTDSIKKIRSDLIIMVDQEGGRVQRFSDNFTSLPSMGKLGAMYSVDADAAIKFTQKCGWLMAVELIACNLDMSLAPVADINYGNNRVIGDRAFSSSSTTIIALVQSFITGMQDAGMANCIKHFPGHGWVSDDSHTALPFDSRSLEEIEKADMHIFKELINTVKIDTLIPAHIVYSVMDSLPAGFSPLWLQQKLREQLQFKGIVISDDLSMVGAKMVGNMTQRVHAASSAGCQLILVCNAPDDLDAAIAAVASEGAQPLSYNHLLASKQWSLTMLQQDPIYLAVREEINSYAN